MYIRMQKNPAITCTVQYSMLRGPCFQFVKLLIKLLFLVLLLQSMLNRFRWTRLRFLKEQCHKIFDTFFHDSNQYRSLIHMLKYFATWSRFRGDMFVCKTKLCGVTNTAESNMLYLIFQQRLFSNLKRQYVISQDFFFFHEEFAMSLTLQSQTQRCH